MKNSPILTPEELLIQWQGHRSLTRRTIKRFPDDKLFTFSIGGMRTFGEMCQELLSMTVPSAKGIATGTWTQFGEIEGAPITEPVQTKKELLEMWDWSTAKLEEFYTQTDPERFQQTDTAFGLWKGKVWWLLFYAIDNEIHHRGQAYVYLRALDIEPPAFWER